MFRYLKVSVGALLLFPSLNCQATIADTDTTATAAQIETATCYNRDYATIRLRYPGIYRVTFDELEKAGLPKDVSEKQLILQSNGQTIPFFRHAGKNTANSYIEFVGDMPRGDITVRRPGNQENVYFLTWGNSADRQQQQEYRIHKSDVKDASTTATVRCIEQLEKDLYLSYTSLPPEISDHYYWIKASSAMPGMYPLRLSFPGLSLIGELPSLTFSLVGLNDNRTTQTGHLYDVSLGKEQLGTVDFSGMTRYNWQTTVSLATAKNNEKLLIQAPESRRNTPDMIALDYIIQTWPRTLDIAKQTFVKLTDDVITTNSEPKPKAIRLNNLPEKARVYCPERATMYLPDEDNGTQVTIDLTDTTGTLYTVNERGWNKVDTITFYPASTAVNTLSSDTQCLLIYHPDTAKAAEYYVKYRESTGLKTQAFDITRIFDTLNHGYISDKTLKSWLRYAFENMPNLKYICLFGDSTNDYREIHYEEREQGEEPHLTNNKVLIPIHWVRNPATRHAAGYPDDNWYGSFHWNNMPDVAVGRIPVNTDAEAMVYLRKIVAYEQAKGTASDKLLLISSVENEFQDLVREVGTNIGDLFTTSVEMFSEAEMANICTEIDNGVQMVYYLGHGGSFVWRFGPTDFQLQKDLFTPAHVRQLTNKNRYPIIVCSSCYVTSFDNRMSLGESFLTEPDKGAVAIIGTPWKTGVYDSHTFMTALFDAFKDKKNKHLGDIFQQAKISTKPRNANFTDYQTFTMLGDPAITLVRTGDVALPAEQQWPIPDADSLTTEIELLRVPSTEFNVRVYRNRSLLTTSTTTLKEVQIPADTTQLMLVGRGNFEMGSFPRLNVRLEMRADDGTTRSLSVFSGFANSLAPSAYFGTIPSAWRGRNVSITISVENPTYLYDERVFRLAYVSFVKEQEN